MPQQTRRKPRPSAFNFTQWLQNIMGYNTPMYYPQGQPAGYRSQGGIAWGTPPPTEEGGYGAPPQPGSGDLTPIPGAANVHQLPTFTGTSNYLNASTNQLLTNLMWRAAMQNLQQQQAAAQAQAGQTTRPQAWTPQTYTPSGQAGYFGGVTPYEGGPTYGGGWGNPNMVYQNYYGTYRPSDYGQRAYGLSELNVNKETGELQGALNRYGQPLGTEAPLMAHGPYRPGRGWSSTTPYGPSKFRMPGVVHPRPKEPGKGGGGNTQSTSGTGWGNELISWRI